MMNIQSLSVSERILLAEQLWDSVRTRSDEVKIPAELVELLDERLADVESDGDLGDNWEMVKKRISEK
ncbi:addiction module protein [Cellvibrio sp.]|uniref:addiction module protein n=1 Tax=Cellvibrio sp. TaxID=1965322 RepID=UPI00269F2123